jgi:hypothetical protein
MRALCPYWEAGALPVSWALAVTLAPTPCFMSQLGTYFFALLHSNFIKIWR